jgi:hypothetical protein
LITREAVDSATPASSATRARVTRSWGVVGADGLALTGGEAAWDEDPFGWVMRGSSIGAAAPLEPDRGGQTTRPVADHIRGNDIFALPF